MSIQQEPAVVTNAYQLCALLDCCGHLVASLDAIPEGDYRVKIISSLSNVLELGARMASDQLTFVEHNAPKAEEGRVS